MNVSESVLRYPEVVEGDLVCFGVRVGQRFEDGSVIPFGLQQLAQLLQHGRAVGRHCRVSRQIRLSDAHKLWEELLCVRILLKQTEERENISQTRADHVQLCLIESGTDRVRTSPPWPV